MVSRSVGAEDPRVNVTQAELPAELFALFAHRELRFAVEGFRLAGRLLRDQIPVHSVFCLGSGEQELFTSQCLRSPDRLQGDLQIFFLKRPVCSRRTSGTAPAEVAEDILRLCHFFQKLFRLGEIVFSHEKPPG